MLRVLTFKENYSIILYMCFFVMISLKLNSYKLSLCLTSIKPPLCPFLTVSWRWWNYFKLNLLHHVAIICFLSLQHLHDFLQFTFKFKSVALKLFVYYFRDIALIFCLLPSIVVINLLCLELVYFMIELRSSINCMAYCYEIFNRVSTSFYFH